MSGTVLVREADLSSLVAGLFEAHGLARTDAERVAACLVYADLRGVASHGVGRVPIYLERLRRGLVKPRPSLAMETPTPAAALIDGDDGLGFLVATKAMDEAVARAATFGIGMVSARRSTHFGMAGCYVSQAIEKGFAAFVFTNASPAMPVWGGKVPFLGTSPFAFGAPGGKNGGAILLDMATSVVARGKIRRAVQSGEPIPEGWALDADGRPTTDAQRAYEGLILPLGGPKGSGLSLMMEVLGGVMSGAAFGGAVRNQYFDFEAPQDVGHCFIAIKPDLFMPREDYDRRIGELVGRAKACPPVEEGGEILMPGEREGRLAEARRRDGIPIGADDLDQLRAEAERAGLSVPAALGRTAAA